MGLPLRAGDIVAASGPGHRRRRFVVCARRPGAWECLPLLTPKASLGGPAIRLKRQDGSGGSLSGDCSVRLADSVTLNRSAGLRRLGALCPARLEEILRARIGHLVGGYYRAVHAGAPRFQPGRTYVRYGGRVYDQEEMRLMVDSALDFWLTEGRFARQFSRGLARFLGVRHCLLTNSGSSANLLALSALTSPTLGDRRLREGDEVITAACGFPTTVTPIVQNRLVPVFVDVRADTYNVEVRQVRRALTGRTKAIFLAHTLGNPFDAEAVMDLASRRGLWLIEDNCDALGARLRGRHTGTFGHLATFSFYPAHHITTGEGGAVVTRDDALARLVASFRDWGRDCWCAPGSDNTCGRRFSWQLGTLPAGYDHKYVYTHLGYNLKMTDPQAAVGVAQLGKLAGFLRARRRNWRRLHEALAPLDRYFLLPRATEGSQPSWFGFVLTVREEAPFTRDQIVRYLEDRRIGTRMLFAGNMTRHPAFEDVRYRLGGDLANTDRILHGTFWVGVYPGMTARMLDYIGRTIRQFVAERTAGQDRASP